MKKLILFCTILFTIFSASQAADLQKLITEGNSYCKKNQFDKAIASYEAVLKEGYASADLYYNLGYAYFKAKNNNKAILNFERAKLLDPSNTDVIDNLEYARSFTVDKIDAIQEVFLVTWFKSVRNFFNLQIWTWLSITLFFSALALFLVYLLANSIGLKKLGFWMGALLLVLTIWSFGNAYSHYSDQTNKNTAIVFSPIVNIKSSPDETGNNLFILHEGTKVKILEKIGDWCEIKISNGGRGFMKLSDLEII